ncbi:MAG: YggT family protein [Bdellovibrionota bacterium]
MIAFGNLLRAIAGMLHMILPIFYVLMLARVVLSWVSPDPRNPIVQFIYNTTEPLLARVRDKIPPLGMFDLSPLIWFLLFYLLDAFLVRSLYDYGSWFLSQSGVAPC